MANGINTLFRLSIPKLNCRRATTGKFGHRLLSFLFHFVHKNLSTFDPSSPVLRHGCAFRFPDGSKAVCFLSRPLRKNPQKGILLRGRLPGIEPELSVPQTDALTVVL